MARCYDNTEVAVSICSGEVLAANSRALSHVPPATRRLVQKEDAGDDISEPLTSQPEPHMGNSGTVTLPESVFNRSPSVGETSWSAFLAPGSP